MSVLARGISSCSNISYRDNRKEEMNVPKCSLLNLYLNKQLPDSGISGEEPTDSHESFTRTFNKRI
jgi:hypothetical protein